MIAPLRPASAPDEAPRPRAARAGDAVLRALLGASARPGAVYLVEHAPLRVELRHDEGAALVLALAPRAPLDAHGLARLRAREAARWSGGEVHLVLLGHDPEAVGAALDARDAAGGEASRGGLRVHALPLEGERGLAGARLDAPPRWLRAALAAVYGDAAPEPWPRGALDAAALAGRARLAERERDLARWSALQRRPPLLTYALAAALVAVHALAASRVPPGPARFALLGAVSQGLFAAPGGLARALTYAWSHADALHLGANTLALVSFGAPLERALGRGRYALLYALGALGGGLAVGRFGAAQVVGASGALWALMAALFVLALRPRGPLPSVVRAHLRRQLYGVLALNALASLHPAVSGLGHAGGAVAGALLAATGALAPPTEARGADRLGALAGAAAAALLAGSLALVLRAIVAGP